MIASFFTRFWVHGVLILALLGCYFVQQHRVDGLQVQVADLKRASADAATAQQSDLRQFAAATRTVTDNIIKDAENEKARMATANSDLDRDAQRLRSDLAKFTAINRALRSAAAANRSATGTASSDLSADGDALGLVASMFTGAEGASTELAKELGHARQRGLRCEAYADAMIAESLKDPTSVSTLRSGLSSTLKLPAWHAAVESESTP